jgi:hypothetical protein
MDTQLAQNAEELEGGQVIKILDKAGIIEESSGRRRFCMFLSGTLLDYEKRMLCVSRCPYTLPMHCTSIEGRERAHYDFTGFLQLEEYVRRNRNNEFQGGNYHKPVCSALELLAEILDSMKGMESYLLFPERFLICPDTIFVHSDGHVSLAYYGNKNPELSLQNRIIALTEDFLSLYNDSEAEQYLDRYKEMILLKNPGLDGMISILGTLKREVSYIYWNTKNFRKEENKSRPEYGGTEQGQIAGDRKGLEFPLKQDARNIKLIAFQVFIAAGLIAVFLFGSFEFSAFAGFSLLTAGADLWLMKKLGLVSPDIYNKMNLIK